MRLYLLDRRLRAFTAICGGEVIVKTSAPHQYLCEHHEEHKPVIFIF